MTLNNYLANKSNEIGVHFESFGMAHKHLKFVGHAALSLLIAKVGVINKFTCCVASTGALLLRLG